MAVSPSRSLVFLGLCLTFYNGKFYYCTCLPVINLRESALPSPLLTPPPTHAPAAPLELLSLYFDCPWLLVVNDFRQGLFIASLLSFWLIFIGEHRVVCVVPFPGLIPSIGMRSCCLQYKLEPIIIG